MCSRNASLIKIKKVLFGNNVSHANNRTRRKFKSNVQKHNIYLDEKNFITVKVPASWLRSFYKNKNIRFVGANASQKNNNI